MLEANVHKGFKWFYKQNEELKDIPKDSILVTADVAESYSSISHKASLKALEKRLDRMKNRKISTNDLIKLAEFV